MKQNFKYRILNWASNSSLTPESVSNFIIKTLINPQFQNWSTQGDPNLSDNQWIKPYFDIKDTTKQNSK